MSKIVTHFDPPPIPLRKFDWCAHSDDYEPGEIDGETGRHVGGDHPVGWGATEAEALEDYLMHLEDR